MSAKAGVFAKREVVVRERVVAARNMEAGAVEERMACMLWRSLLLTGKRCYVVVDVRCGDSSAMN